MTLNVCPADTVHAPVERVWDLLMQPAGYGRFWELRPSASGRRVRPWLAEVRRLNQAPVLARAENASRRSCSCSFSGRKIVVSVARHNLLGTERGHVNRIRRPRLAR